jgi:hypothetical protein
MLIAEIILGKVDPTPGDAERDSERTEKTRGCHGQSGRGESVWRRHRTELLYLFITKAFADFAGVVGGVPPSVRWGRPWGNTVAFLSGCSLRFRPLLYLEAKARSGLGRFSPASSSVSRPCAKRVCSVQSPESRPKLDGSTQAEYVVLHAGSPRATTTSAATCRAALRFWVTVTRFFAVPQTRALLPILYERLLALLIFSRLV